MKYLFKKLNLFKNLSELNSQIDQDRELSTIFKNSLQHMFSCKLSTALRNLLVDNILKKIEVKLNNEETFEGLEYMLENNYFQDAFILHEETRFKFELKQN